MNEQEALAFESHPDAELFIRLRYWDDKAKEIDQPIENLPHLRLMAIEHLYKNN